MAIREGAATTVDMPLASGTTTDAPVHPPQALIYARVSQPAQAADGSSLRAQIARCRDYAAVNDWEVAGEYTDVMSGARDDRPNYQHLLAEASSLRDAHGQVVVVIASLDRLGRRLLESLRCRRALASLGVPVHSVAEGGEVPDVVANILAAVAHEEVQQTSRRVKAVQQHAVEQGWYFGGGRPWGYVWRPATAEERAESSPRSVIDLDPIRSPYVREMFARAADGQNCHSLERWLDTLPGEATGGRVMRSHMVDRALRSPLYVGRRLRGDADVLDRAPGRWPALVDDDTWTRVQERLHSPLARNASGRYLLTSLLRCHRCGGPAGGTVGGAGYGPYYHCNRNLICGTSIGQTGVLEAQVLNRVRPLFAALLPADPRARARLVRVWAAALEPRPTVVRRTLGLTEWVQRGQRRLASAGVLLESGDLDQAAYDLIARAVQGDLDTARSQLMAIRHAAPGRGIPSPHELEARIRAWDTLFREGETALRREALAALIERVRVERVGTRTYRVKIDWSTLGNLLRTARRRMRSTVEGAGS